MGDLSSFTPLIGLVTNMFGGGTSAGASGSVTPQEAALAEYEGQQREIANRQRFSQGMGHSTGETYAAAGSQLQTAAQMAGMADTNAAQQNSLNQLANNAGFTSGGSFGNTGGGGGEGGGSSVNTTPDVSS